MKSAPHSRQHHDLYAKYHYQDSEIRDLLGEYGLIVVAVGVEVVWHGLASHIAALL
ncbi:hypothetical protein [Marivita sp.]|uniref:hypothetical protein n=1 Tax=Marivita sp. TaxID=2003365 RepID=UPI003B58BBC4